VGSRSAPIRNSPLVRFPIEYQLRMAKSAGVQPSVLIQSEATGFDAGEQYPDPFLSLRTDQTWSSASLSGGIHDVNATPIPRVAPRCRLPTTASPAIPARWPDLQAGSGRPTHFSPLAASAINCLDDFETSTLSAYTWRIWWGASLSCTASTTSHHRATT
jgi:hypothetical protein